MSVDEQSHVAFPRLFGAPAYARPPSAADRSERPFDLDDLPIIAELTPEEREQLGAMEAARPGFSESAGHGLYVPPGHPAGFAASGVIPAGERALAGRPFALRALANRFRGGARSRP